MTIQNVIKDVLATSTREQAIENLLRIYKNTNTNYFAQAEILQHMSCEYGFAQFELAALLRCKQPTIANKLRLLSVEVDKRASIIENGLTERHVRAVLAAPASKRAYLFQEIAKHRLNVAESEQLAKNVSRETFTKGKPIIKDIRLYINSIAQTVEKMKSSGVNAKLTQTQAGNKSIYIITVQESK